MTILTLITNFIHRIFGQFTMETILATAFGFQVEKDEDRLTKAASEIFTGSNAFAIVTSEVLCCKDNYMSLLNLYSFSSNLFLLKSFWLLLCKES